jgi:hypothetical protein
LIKPNQQLFISWADMVTKNGTRFDSKTTAVKDSEIECLYNKITPWTWKGLYE